MSRLTNTAIKTALQAWLVADVASLDDAHVIFQNQADPRPKTTPYATIFVPTRIPVGQEHEYGFGTDPGAPAYVPRKMAGDRKMTASIQLFGTGAMDLAAEAAESLNKQTTCDIFYAAGLAPVAGLPTVNAIPQLLETEYEERAQFDAEFLFIDTYTDDQPVIERVSGTETLQHPAGTDVRDIDFDTTAGV